MLAFKFARLPSNLLSRSLVSSCYSYQPLQFPVWRHFKGALFKRCSGWRGNSGSELPRESDSASCLRDCLSNAWSQNVPVKGLDCVIPRRQTSRFSCVFTPNVLQVHFSSPYTGLTVLVRGGNLSLSDVTKGTTYSLTDTPPELKWISCNPRVARC